VGLDYPIIPKDGVIIVSEPSQITPGLAADYHIISDLGFPAIYTLHSHQLLDKWANKFIYQFRHRGTAKPDA